MTDNTNVHHPYGGSTPKLVWSVGWFSGIALVATGAFYLYNLQMFIGAASTANYVVPTEDLNNLIALIVIAALWTVLPPVCFWFEYYFIWTTKDKPDRSGKLDKDNFDALKYGQDLSSKIWAGAVAVQLFALSALI